MAKIAEIDQDAWNEWVAGRPPVVQEMCAKLPPDRLYLLTPTGVICSALVRLIRVRHHVGHPALKHRGANRINELVNVCRPREQCSERLILARQITFSQVVGVNAEDLPVESDGVVFPGHGDGNGAVF